MSGTHIKDVMPLPYDYFLRKLSYGDYSELEISQSDFDDIKKARQILVSARSLEEKYDVLLENYVLFEQKVAEICIRSMARGSDGYSDMYEKIRDLNVSVATLLSAAKMYTDHQGKDIKVFSTSDWNSVAFRTELLNKCREDKYFRLVEGVRNYAQHVSVPISNTKIGGQWTIDAGEKHTCCHSLEMYVSKSALSGVRELRRSTLCEFGDQIDLKYSLGRYISALGKLHLELRKKIKTSVDLSRACFVKNFEKYKTVSKEVHSLAAVHAPSGVLAETIDIHLNWDDVRINLEKRNNGVRDFSINYISTISAMGLQMEGGREDKC